MKKFTLAMMLAAMMLFAASSLFAEGMMFGVKGGLNIANLTGDDVEDASSKTAVVAGVFFSYDITEIFAVQPELLFSMKGTTMDAEEGEENWKTTYLELPLLLKVNLPTEGKIKPMLYAGPAFGLLMSAKVEDEDIKDQLKTMDIGIVAGAGVGYQLEKGLIFAEARYEIGLTGLTDFSDAELDAIGMTEQPDAKNSTISIMVGYGFPF
ncbi:MAG: porin family protein [Candidatus Krumholzibacteria bacterium]|nr:porin family protein [Candidatus Krumholzibacteria bacterium]